jgi:endonuclease/exonuclease/phosphatase (EEP) superfamily protein YafD
VIFGLAACTALATSAVSAGALGGVVSDRLDVLAHFAPVTLTLAGLATLTALLSGTGRACFCAAVLGLFAIASSAALIAPELAAAARPLAAAPPLAERLRVLQFNVLRSNPEPEATAAAILAIDPDVIVLEEAHGPAAAIPKRLRSRYPHQVGCDDPRPCGTRILSRRPPLEVGGLQAPHTRDGSVNAAWMTLPLRAGGRATVVGTHYTWPLPAGAQQAQSRALGALLRRFPQETLIVTGDMNSTPWSFSLRRQDRRFNLERRTRGLFSWPAAVGRPAFLPIDHLYAGSAWRTVAVRRGRRTASDHYPVVADLAHAPS